MIELIDSKGRYKILEIPYVNDTYLCRLQSQYLIDLNIPIMDAVELFVFFSCHGYAILVYEENSSSLFIFSCRHQFSVSVQHTGRSKLILA